MTVAACKRLVGTVALAAALAGCGGPPPSDKLEVAARSVQSAALSRDGQWAVIGSGYHGGSLWHVPDGERLYNWNHSADDPTLILQTAFSPNGQWAATVDERTLVLWSRETGQSRGYWRIPSEVLDIALGPEGRLALLGLADGRAVIYNVREGGVVASLPHNERVSAVALSDDISLAVTASESGRMNVWNWRDDSVQASARFDEPVQLVAISPDGGRALVGVKYDQVSVLDTATAEPLWQLPYFQERLLRGLNVVSARFSPDGGYLLTGRPDGYVELWGLAERERIYRWQLPKRKAWQPTAAPVIDVSFTGRDDTYRAVGGNGYVYTLSY